MRSDALPWLFISERALTRQSVNYLIATAARRAGLSPVNPHMLRHSCGFYLANRSYDLRLIQDYLGHRDPKHTVHYTRVAGYRFEGLWRVTAMEPRRRSIFENLEGLGARRLTDILLKLGGGCRDQTTTALGAGR